MSDDPIGYTELNLGLNNQKIALLGLIDKALQARRPISLPRLSLFDPSNDIHRTVEFGEIFDIKMLQRFAANFGLQVIPKPTNQNVGTDGWSCFMHGASTLGREAARGMAGINEFASQFFNHLVAYPTKTELFKRLSDHIYRDMNIKSVLQLRIEKDWVLYSEKSLKNSIRAGEDYLPSFHSIIKKLKNTLCIPSNILYVVCDESNLPTSKEEIKDEVLRCYGIKLMWKSDIISKNELDRLSHLELSIIDFEMAVRAPYFVSLSRSTFSSLAIFERFCRTRQPVSTHYIYNLQGDRLGRRTDNGSRAVPEQSVNPVHERRLLINHSSDDCLWPATLIGHISGIGDFVSEGCLIAGVRAGSLVCGFQGAGKGLIEGFTIVWDVNTPVGIEYRALLDNGTWTNWVSNSTYVGTKGQNRPLFGFSIRLTGPLAMRFQCIAVGCFVGHNEAVKVYYGEDCRAIDAASLEAMQIIFRPVFQSFEASESEHPSVSY